jgi:hypothetical protein
MIIPGCIAPSAPVKPSDANNPGAPQATPTTQESSIFDRRLQRRTVEFTVHRFSAPRGVFSGSEEIWNLVTGSLASAEATLHLAENGFRAAIGRESHREALLQFLKGLPELRSAVDHATPDSTRMVDLELGSTAANVAIFYIDNKGVLHGLDFVDAKARLKLTYEMRSPRFDELWLRIVPELEEPPGPMKWLMTAEGPREQAEERRHTFDELACEAEVPPGGFLLLGPTPPVYDRPLAAKPFFIEKSAGHGAAITERESIFIISPVIRTAENSVNGARPAGSSGEKRTD